MKLNLKKVMAETNIKKIKRQLEELDALEAQSKLQPGERMDDTYLVVTHDDQRKKLLKDLEKYQKIVAESDGRK